jgi:hypothetical protein
MDNLVQHEEKLANFNALSSELVIWLYLC